MFNGILHGLLLLLNWCMNSAAIRFDEVFTSEGSRRFQAAPVFVLISESRNQKSFYGMENDQSLC